MATDDREQDHRSGPQLSDQEAYRVAGEELHRMREELRGRTDQAGAAEEADPS
jgi:hypothetical protein